MTAALIVRGISKSFRGLRALTDVSFDVPAGSIVGLIGPNGAGKTTCFSVIAGALKPDSGEVQLDGKRVDGLRPDQACAIGIARTFQIVRPFGGLTVEENVIVGALRADPNPQAARRRARDVLDRLELGDKKERPAASLTLPERKRLEVARALATGPRLLLLDEVMAGLRPTETDRVVEILIALNRESGMTILLIEHVMRAVMALSSRIVVLHHGEVIANGTPEAVSRDPRVLESYLGHEAPC